MSDPERPAGTGKIREPTEEELASIIDRGVAEIIPRKEFEQALRSGRQLRLKMGFDPTRSIITLGWAAGLRKLRQLQELGHQVVIIIGDWTAQIGDPSGVSQTRAMLTEGEVSANSELILNQFYKLLDRNRTEIRRQSEWFGQFTPSDLVQLAARFTVAQLIQRDDFAKRLAGHRPVGMHELLYPLLQAYDSVAVNSDVEFGGTDQRFNILLGRELQAMMGQKPQLAFLMPLLVGLDGTKKMSQSLDNYISIEALPGEMYGKIMSIPDSIMTDYLELLTDMKESELIEVRSALDKREVNPRDIKKNLAWQVVKQFHSMEAAEEASEEFTRVFGRGEAPKEEIPEYQLTDDTLAHERGGAVHDIAAIILRAGLAASASDARRLIKQGAVEIAEEKLVGNMAVIEPGNVIKVGKHRFLRIIDADKQ